MAVLFGDRDNYALRRFQKDNGLAADGWAGPYPCGAKRTGRYRRSLIFPMNINPALWRDLGFAGRDPGDPVVNIRAGVTLLKRIRDRLDDPVPEAIGTLYNGLAKDKVTEYGAYIGRLMQEKPWQKN